MRHLPRLLLLLLLLSAAPLPAQNETRFSKQPRERKRLWRHWNKNKDGYNPYLKKKGKNKPSAQAARSNKREMRRQKRDYKRQLKDAKK